MRRWTSTAPQRGTVSLARVRTQQRPSLLPGPLTRKRVLGVQPSCRVAARRRRLHPAAAARTVGKALSRPPSFGGGGGQTSTIKEMRRARCSRRLRRYRFDFKNSACAVYGRVGALADCSRKIQVLGECVAWLALRWRQAGDAAVAMWEEEVPGAVYQRHLPALGHSPTRRDSARAVCTA